MDLKEMYIEFYDEFVDEYNREPTHDEWLDHVRYESECAYIEREWQAEKKILYPNLYKYEHVL